MTQALKSVDQIPTVEYTPESLYNRLPQFVAWARELGPVVKQDWPDGGRVVYLIGAEANKLVMQSQREQFSHDLGWTPNIGETLGKGLLNMDPPEHDRHRKMMNPAFAIAYMSRYLPVMNRLISERARDWVERGEVDLFEETRKITFDVAAETLVGFRAGPQVDLLRELFFKLINGDGQQFASEAEWMQSVLPIRDRLMGELVRLIEARRGIPADDRSDILAMMVNARDEDGNGLSVEQMLGHVNILLVAGHETTTTLSAWLLYLLSTHPQQLAVVQAEVEALAGREGEITLEAVRAMKQLGYAVQEAGRMYPPVAMVPRGVLEDVEFGGYLLPKGTFVFLPIGAAHWDAAIFPNPERFEPERFAPPREEDKRTPYALATFGGGPRICIGVNFARVEVTAMAAEILRRFTLTPVAPEEVRQIYPGIIGQPEKGIRVRVEAR
ncbi:MAG: cytochrome P450 [Roseiflexaceae bacterium]|nr:cytochrome P450 [Roseiflexaceae bacterium]